MVDRQPKPMGEYKISSVGQITFPASIRDRWQVQYGSSYVKAAYLEQAVLIIPDGSEWPLLESFYPQSQLRERATMKIEKLPQLAASPSTVEVDVFNAYKLSSVGQMSVPPAMRT